MSTYESRWAELEVKRLSVASSLQALDFSAQRREAERGRIGIFYRNQLQQALKQLHTRKFETRRLHQEMSRRIDEQLAMTCRRSPGVLSLKQRKRDHAQLVQKLKSAWLTSCHDKTSQRLEASEQDLAKSIQIRQQEQAALEHQNRSRQRLAEQKNRLLADAPVRVVVTAHECENDSVKPAPKTEQGHQYPEKLHKPAYEPIMKPKISIVSDSAPVTKPRPLPTSSQETIIKLKENESVEVSMWTPKAGDPNIGNLKSPIQVLKQVSTPLVDIARNPVAAVPINTDPNLNKSHNETKPMKPLEQVSQRFEPEITGSDGTASPHRPLGRPIQNTPVLHVEAVQESTYKMVPAPKPNSNFSLTGMMVPASSDDDEDTSEETTTATVPAKLEYKTTSTMANKPRPFLNLSSIITGEESDSESGVSPIESQTAPTTLKVTGKPKTVADESEFDF